MPKKWKVESKKTKRSQTNYIKNYHNLVNIEQLNAGEAFWFGLAVGLFTTFWLMNDKLEKKANV